MKWTLIGFKTCLNGSQALFDEGRNLLCCHVCEMDLHCNDHFVYAPSQWERTLHCCISHWLDAFTECSLHWCLNWVSSSISWRKESQWYCRYGGMDPHWVLMAFMCGKPIHSCCFCFLFLSEFLTLFKSWCNISISVGNWSKNNGGLVSILNVNLLWPDDAICRHRTGSTLAQLMAWCLMTSSHYLNHCRLFTS